MVRQMKQTNFDIHQIDHQIDIYSARYFFIIALYKKQTIKRLYHFQL